MNKLKIGKSPLVNNCFKPSIMYVTPITGEKHPFKTLENTKNIMKQHYNDKNIIS